MVSWSGLKFIDGVSDVKLSSRPPTTSIPSSRISLKDLDWRSSNHARTSFESPCTPVGAPWRATSCSCAYRARVARNRRGTLIAAMRLLNRTRASSRSGDVERFSIRTPRGSSLCGRPNAWSIRSSVARGSRSERTTQVMRSGPMTPPHRRARAAGSSACQNLAAGCSRLSGRPSAARSSCSHSIRELVPPRTTCSCQKELARCSNERAQ